MSDTMQFLILSGVGGIVGLGWAAWAATAGDGKRVKR